MEDKFNTHKFLYKLFYEGSVKGHTIFYVDKNGLDKKVDIERIEIGASPVSFKVFDKKDQKHVIAFVRVKKVFYKGREVWENSDFNINDSKIIKGFDKEK